MASFIVNGHPVTVEKNQKLIRYLRDTLHLTSVKDGCSEGACGTCHVLIDGKPTKACVPQTEKLEGKTIVTVEGLSDWEKQVYVFAFGEAGAVQCGFCIPGMVISAKALLDVNPDPTREEAAFAIRNNICRCTGYVKIIDGILLAGKIFREGKLPQPTADDWQMGSRVHRLDVAEKVLGYGQYPDDVYVDGMCYGSAVRSQYARARVLSIDTSEAEALPGVVCVLTQKDIPGKVNVGHLKKDQPTMIGIGEITHYLGDAVALVCARDRETLEEAKKLVKVAYEVLPAVHNPEEAAAPDAPLVFEEEESNVQAYKHVSRGNAEEAIRRFAIRARGPGQVVAELSGGNQQKVVLAKWLATDPRILILDEPTRGVDVGAKTEIHKLMNDLARQGLAIVMISSELPEVLGMSDRVLVMGSGRVVTILDRADATPDAVGAAMMRGAEA